MVLFSVFMWQLKIHTVEYQDPNTEIHGTAHYVKYKRSFPDATEGD